MCDGYLAGVNTTMTIGEFLGKQSDRMMDWSGRIKSAKKLAWEALRKRDGK